MAFNGSGTFLINTAGQPVVSGTVISSTAFNALTADLATGLSTAITKDGQTTVTANIPMSTYKFTGLGVGSAATDSANLSQVQSTVTKLLNSVSGADTITATASPTLAAYAAGQMFYFVAAGDNTTSVTLNIDALGAKAVTRDGSTALVAADIKSGEVIVVVYDGTRFQVVSQLNSAGDARFANVSIASSLYVGGVSTFVGNAGFSANVSIASALSVGGVAAITGATTIGGNLTLSGGTANGVLHLNGSKVATSGTALVFDGTNLGLGVTPSGSWGSPALMLGKPGASNPTYPFITSPETQQIVVGSNSYWDGTNWRAAFAGSAVVAMQQRINYNQITWHTATAVSQGSTQSFTQAMTLDTSGNLGIGTASPGAKLDVSSTTDGDTVRISFPSAATGTTGGGLQFRAYTNSAVLVEQSRIQSICTDGSATYGAAMRFMTANGGSLSEKMRLDSSGNLGIGTTTIGSRVTISDPGTGLAFSNAASGNFNIGLLAGTGSAVAYVYQRANSDLLFGTNNTERARIDSSGRMIINGTAQLYSSTLTLYRTGNSYNFASNVTGTGSEGHVVFENGNGAVGTIFTNGSATAYNTSSDRRLKSNIAPADNAGSVIDAIEVVKHDWKAGGHTRYGMIAQDLYIVAPEAVSVGDADDVEDFKNPWGVDYSKLVPMLVKEVQSLRKRVAELESK